MDQPQLSRRSLLAAAAVGAVSGIAQPLPAADQRSPSTRPSSDRQAPLLRWGVIGTGTRGGWTHIPVLKEAPRSETIALCDVSEQRLKSAAERVGHPVRTYPDYQKLLADPDINAVVIAVPNLFHKEILLAALQAGKHVLCEKPAGTSPEEGLAIKAAVDSAKTVVMFGMQYRHMTKQKKIAEIIAKGEIGKPKYLLLSSSRGDWNTSANVWQYADPKLGGKPINWRYSHRATGGTLNEFSCHYFDLLNWYAGGTPHSVSADGGISFYHDGRDTWDHATITLQYPNQVTAVHTLCLFGPIHTDLSIMGTEGTIETAPKETLRLTRFTKPGSNTGAKIQEIDPDPGPQAHSADRPTLALYQDFLACVQTGKKPDASIDRALTACRTCWLAELASEHKSELKGEELAPQSART